MRIDFLHWDSEFFGKRIYNLTITRPPNREDALLLNKLEADLLYITVTDPLPETMDFCLKLGAVLYDKKVTYSKDLPAAGILKTTNISFKAEYDLTASLEAMVYQSGVYSRFNLDPGLSSQFEQLYKIWINKSLTRELADEVFIAFDDSIELGFITLQKQDKNGKIGLIAVDEKQRGKKVGLNLLIKADEWFADNELTTAKVITQLDNIPACRLYEKAGYEIEKIDYIFHLWK